jgi:hypothetical protein
MSLVRSKHATHTDTFDTHTLLKNVAHFAAFGLQRGTD